MDRGDIGPHVKIMVVYEDVDHNKWVRHGGRGCSGCNGRAHVFIRQEKAAEVGAKVDDVVASRDF